MTITTKSLVFAAAVLCSMPGCRAARAWRAARHEKAKPAATPDHYAAEHELIQAGADSPAVDDPATAPPADSPFWSISGRRAARTDRFPSRRPRAGRC
jgi:hypothetical protein